MSLADLKTLAAANPDLMARLSSVETLSELEAIAKEVGISIDPSELEDEEIASQELSAITGGIGMLLSAKGGDPKPDLSTKADCGITDTRDETKTCKPIVVSTRRGESPSCK